jgi:hypothetical protein
MTDASDNETGDGDAIGVLFGDEMKVTLFSVIAAS